MPGPPDYLAWLRCWNVYQTALLLLGGFDQQPLSDYAEWIRALSEKYSQRIGKDAWAIVYEADVRMRQEHFERIRRALDLHIASGLPLPPGTALRYDAQHPWNLVFAMAINTQFTEAVSFWKDEVFEVVALRANYPRKGGRTAAHDPDALYTSPTDSPPQRHPFGKGNRNNGRRARNRGAGKGSGTGGGGGDRNPNGRRGQSPRGKKADGKGKNQQAKQGESAAPIGGGGAGTKRPWNESQQPNQRGREQR